MVLVRIDGALHDILAQSPRGIDEHDAIETRFGIDREHHARACEVGPHHLLHPYRKGHFQVIESLGFAIADGAIGEERGEAAAAGVKHGSLAANIEEGLLLTGKTRIREILCRGA